jgi:hypothetical protein
MASVQYGESKIVLRKARFFHPTWVCSGDFKNLEVNSCEKEKAEENRVETDPLSRMRRDGCPAAGSRDL